MKVYYSLKYLLTHEDYVGLNINQKINVKTLSFNYDRNFKKDIVLNVY